MYAIFFYNDEDDVDSILKSALYLPHDFVRKLFQSGSQGDADRSDADKTDSLGGINLGIGGESLYRVGTFPNNI